MYPNIFLKFAVSSASLPWRICSRNLSICSSNMISNRGERTRPDVLLSNHHHNHKLSYNLTSVAHISSELIKESSALAGNDILKGGGVVGTRDFLPVDMIAKLFEGLHNVIGVPWWLSIILGTMLVRTAILLPLSVVGERAALTHMQLRPGFDSKMRTLLSECESALAKGRFKNDAEMRRHYRLNMQKEKAAFYSNNRCHPALFYAAPITTVPIFVALTFGTRTIMYDRQETVDGVLQVVANDSFHNGGLWFFSDMLLPDPTFILPIFRFAVILLQAELNTLRSPVNSKMSLFVNWVLLRGGAAYLLYVSVGLPAGLVYCWCISAVLGLVQSILLMNPAVRTKLKIPTLPNDPRRWDEVIRRAKQRYLRHSPTTS